MIKLRETDGVEPHLRALSHHSRECRKQKNDPFLQNLRAESEAKHSALKAKTREVEDASETLLDLTAEVDGEELALENEVRNTLDDVSRIERQQPRLGILTAVFPKGLNEVISPERKKQPTTIRDLLQRLSPFLSSPEVQASAKRLSQALSNLELALENREEGGKIFAVLFAQEQALRAEARAQLTGAFGQLTHQYKTNPALAEALFIANPRTGSTALSGAENRGRIFGKQEALLLFFEQQKTPLTEEQRQMFLEINEEERIEQLLRWAYSGTSLTDILARLSPPTA
jgi:hypothetical protein